MGSERFFNVDLQAQFDNLEEIHNRDIEKLNNMSADIKALEKQLHVLVAELIHHVGE